MTDTDLLLNGTESAESVATGDELFEAYQNGKSAEELYEMMRESETTQAVSPEESDEAEEVVTETTEDITDALASEQPKPFKEFKTQEEWQKFFDNAFNHRYGEMRRTMTEKEERLNETNGLLADLLGVSKENAFEELKKRKYTMEAEREGYADPTQYAALKNAESQIAELKRANENRQKEEADRLVNEQVADIRRQGEALSQKVASFNIDKAMENIAFRQTVFSLHRAGETDAVEKAFKACFFDEFMKSQSAQKKETVARPIEGATAPKTQTAVKPLNIAAMSGADIRKIERDILAGKYVDLG